MPSTVQIRWDPTDTPETLKAAYLAERHGPTRSRLHALWLLRRGWPAQTTADAVGRDPSTVSVWLRWYREDGLTAYSGPHAATGTLFPDAGAGSSGGGRPDRALRYGGRCAHFGSRRNWGTPTGEVASTPCCTAWVCGPRFPVLSPSERIPRRSAPGRKGAPGRPPNRRSEPDQRNVRR